MEEARGDEHCRRHVAVGAHVRKLHTALVCAAVAEARTPVPRLLQKWAQPCRICAGTGLTPASALGAGCERWLRGEQVQLTTACRSSPKPSGCGMVCAGPPNSSCTSAEFGHVSRLCVLGGLLRPDEE